MDNKDNTAPQGDAGTVPTPAEEKKPEEATAPVGTGSTETTPPTPTS